VWIWDDLLSVALVKAMGGVGVVGFEGIVMIGELGDVLPPPPQAESSTHAASALRRRRFNQLPPE
jgi:hypothetical protein